MYSPDYTVSRIWDAFVPHIRSGVLPGDPLAELELGLRQIEHSEAYQDYGIPSMIPFSDLKSAKTFVEWFGNRRFHSGITLPSAGTQLGLKWETPHYCRK